MAHPKFQADSVEQVCSLSCGVDTFSLSSLHVINHATPFFTAPYVWQRPVIVKDGSPATLLLTVKQLSFYS